MRIATTTTVLLLAAATVMPAAAQDAHGAMEHRGAMVMGFDQQRTVHHFRLFADGGAIEVDVKDPSDTTDREAIRGHLPHIAEMFGAGNFEAPMLVHDTNDVPGTAAMARLADRIRYTYVQTERGGRIDIITADRDALSAVHDFLRFQIRDHATGDSPDVTTRGRD